MEKAKRGSRVTTYRHIRDKIDGQFSAKQLYSQMLDSCENTIQRAVNDMLKFGLIAKKKRGVYETLPKLYEQGDRLMDYDTHIKTIVLAQTQPYTLDTIHRKSEYVRSAGKTRELINELIADKKVVMLEETDGARYVYETVNGVPPAEQGQNPPEPDPEPGHDEKPLDFRTVEACRKIEKLPMTNSERGKAIFAYCSRLLTKIETLQRDCSSMAARIAILEAELDAEAERARMMSSEVSHLRRVLRDYRKREAAQADGKQRTLADAAAGGK